MIQYASELYGGGGLPVNSIIPLFTGGKAPDLYVSPTGEKWLITGVVEMDATKYPDAHQSGGALTGNQLDISADISGLKSSTSHGGFFWVLDGTLNKINKFDFNGTLLQSVAYSTNYNALAVIDDDLFLIATSAANIYRYDLNSLTIEATAFNLGGYKYAICSDGVDLYIGLQDRIQKVSKTGTLLVDKTLEFTPVALIGDGSNIWAANPQNVLIQLDTDLNETGAKITLDQAGPSITALIAGNGKLWAGSYGDRLLNEIQLGVVGEGTAYTDPVTGAPYYVKVK